VFIEAKNRYYGFQICPGFWVSLAELCDRRRVCCIDRIKDELCAVDDELKEWVETEAVEPLFKQTQDQAVVDSFQSMVQWVYDSEQFADSAKQTFASVADGWVLAYAHANDLIVVTHEEYAPEAVRRVPMPNVCVEFDIGYVNTFRMLADLGVEFIRKTKHRSR
jgi:hypothetical protein